jgi:hypothetical protein
MARPKGTIQKRDEAKYWLPQGIELIDILNKPNYRKDTKLIFNDPIYGNFVSTFKAIQDANASTHPLAVQKRREETNLQKYGHINPGANQEVKEKRTKTIFERFGVNNALENKDLLKKSQDTLMKNHGIKNTMQSQIIRDKIKTTNIKKYGSINPMGNKDVVDRIKKTSLEKYGYDNPSKSPLIKEKILKAQIENQKSGSSKGERSIRDYIESLGLSTQKYYIGGANPREIDILIPEKKIAVEYNGAYFHSEKFAKMTSRYHLNKTLMCQEKGIKLLQFFDFEWEDRNKQVKSFLRSALGKNERKIYARKCEIVELNKIDTNQFLEDYHILGKTLYNHSYGLVCDNELLALITIGKHHRGRDEWILSRYVGKENVTVIGGLTRLCEYAKQKHNTIYTWIDFRMSDGQNWIKNGWEVIHQLPPDYFYIEAKTHKIISKQSRQKKKINTPIGMTEHEHALHDGLYRIYDCGKIKLKYA